MEDRAPPVGWSAPIEWHVSEHVISRYATNLVVQHTQNEFIISFFEVRPPLVLGTPEEVREQLNQMKSVRAECVGRIIVAAEKMPDFVRVLQANLETYLSRRAEE
ncbi:MAG: DUF3467 domain-containing protein [Ardenticatenaceae bacterium]|nr:DUF3467 domain-containing protein [Ardenticatenaceae bacterium]